MSFGGIVALLRAAFLFLTATQLSPNVQSFRGNAISVAEPLINGTTSVPASSSAPNSIQNTITTSGPGTIASISYLSPSSGHAGTVVTIHGTGITATGNTVEFASADSRGLADMRSLNSSDGATLTFTVPATLGSARHGDSSILTAAAERQRRRRRAPACLHNRSGPTAGC